MTATEEEKIEKVTNEYFSQEFNDVNEELRKYFKRATNEIENVKEKVNELVLIVKNDNKDWYLKKICDYIAGRNDDLEEFGFSSKTIERYLTEENKNKLVDSSRDSSKSKKKGRTKLQNNVRESDVDSCPHHVLEDSSSSGESLKESAEPTDEPEEVIYDKDLLNKHVKQIAKLQEENAKLNIDRIPTRANKFDFRYEIELNDEMLQLLKANSGICPLIGTAFRDKDDGYIRFDREKIEQDIKVAQKKK